MFCRLTALDIYEDYRHPDFKHSSGYCAELDIFVPKVNLAIEYQGEQHYYDIYSWADQRSHAERDREKQQLCLQVTFFCLLPYIHDREE